MALVSKQLTNNDQNSKTKLEEVQKKLQKEKKNAKNWSNKKMYGK